MPKKRSCNDCINFQRGKCLWRIELPKGMLSTCKKHNHLVPHLVKFVGFDGKKMSVNEVIKSAKTEL